MSLVSTLLIVGGLMFALTLVTSLCMVSNLSSSLDEIDNKLS